MDLPTAFSQIKSAFPSMAMFQGIHFKYVLRNNVLLLEIKRGGKFFYWLLGDGDPVLFRTSEKSRLAPMKTIGDSFPTL